MNEDQVFKFEKDGLVIIGTTDGLIFKRNGLSIEVSFDECQTLLDEMDLALQDISFAYLTKMIKG